MLTGVGASKGAVPPPAPNPPTVARGSTAADRLPTDLRAALTPALLRR